MATKKVKITVSTLRDHLEMFAKAFSDIKEGLHVEPYSIISFATFEQYMRTFTSRRMELLKITSLKKPKTISELAKMANRDFKNVYSDVKLLETYGMIKLKKINSGLMPIAVYNEIDLDIKIPLTA